MTNHFWVKYPFFILHTLCRIRVSRTPNNIVHIEIQDQETKLLTVHTVQFFSSFTP